MKRARVLLIEDDPSDAACARSILETDFDVDIASRLSAALECVRRSVYDVAVLNMTLPDATGADALARLLQTAPRLPVVILSGDVDERLATIAMQSGAQDYLLKGHLSEVALRRALRYAIERHELSDRLAASVDELERQRASVMALNQLKNDLIAVLAHDIKGPLTSIIGFAELLEEGFLEGEGATSAAQTIRTNAQRLATLANDVLALSRVEHGELEIADERVDLIEIVRNVIALHAPERTVNLHAPVEHAAVRGDAERLKQVFDNIVRNAIKYSPNAAPIDVSIEAMGDRYAVEVTDRGMGIPEEDLPKLFERFARASNARRAKIAGTGIGLFIVKLVVERHAGTVAVRSTLGEGSTFTVTLPSIEAPAHAHPRRVTILSADRDLSRFGAYELRARGYRVREAASLGDLLQAGDVRAGEVILVDESSATAMEVRAAFPRGPVRLVGVGGSPDGWDAVLPRPFLVADLLSAVADGAGDPAAPA